MTAQSTMRGCSRDNNCLAWSQPPPARAVREWWMRWVVSDLILCFSWLLCPQDVDVHGPSPRHVWGGPCVRV